MHRRSGRGGAAIPPRTRPSSTAPLTILPARSLLCRRVKKLPDEHGLRARSASKFPGSQLRAWLSFRRLVAYHSGEQTHLQRESSLLFTVPLLGAHRPLRAIRDVPQRAMASTIRFCRDDPNKTLPALIVPIAPPASINAARPPQPVGSRPQANHEAVRQRQHTQGGVRWRPKR